MWGRGGRSLQDADRDANQTAISTALAHTNLITHEAVVEQHGLLPLPRLLLRLLPWLTPPLSFRRKQPAPRPAHLHHLKF